MHLYTAQHISHYIKHTGHYTLQTAHYTLQIANCTMQTAHFTLHTAHCTMHTVHCTLHNTPCVVCPRCRWHPADSGQSSVWSGTTILNSRRKCRKGNIKEFRCHLKVPGLCVLDLDSFDYFRNKFFNNYLNEVSLQRSINVSVWKGTIKKTLKKPKILSLVLPLNVV